MAKSGRSVAGATLVALGIFLSRIAGLVRQKAMAHFLGSTAAADAFNAAFRIPNLLQNLFGEGALSASFIPVYASLLARGDAAAADRVAGAVGTGLMLVCAVVVALGASLAPWLVWAIAPGFEGETEALTVGLVRVLFPGAGLLVVSAWCLGVLNSHRRFLLSYAAPVVWNAAMIAALLAFGPGRAPESLVLVLAWASVAGSFLQFAIQLPSVLAVAPGLRPSVALRDPHVREIVRNFGPAFVGRGVLQLSSYVDSMISSLLPTGSVAVVGYAQTLYTLPVSLFGMSVSAAELPDLARMGADPAQMRDRMDAALARIAFFVVPSAVAFVSMGDVVAAGLFQSGQFGREDAVRVWAALAGSAFGMLAQTWGRLYSSSFYALQDTRVPLRYATVRVAVSGGTGIALSVFGPGLLGVDPAWGVTGLTLAGGLGGWLEYTLLKGTLDARIGRTGLPAAHMARLWGAALVSGAVGFGLGRALSWLPPIPLAVIACGGFGVVYLVITGLLGLPEVRPFLRRLRLVR